MKKLVTFVLVFGVCVLAGLHEARAQAQVEIGPRLGFDLTGHVEDFFIGADARFGFSNLPVLVNGALDIYLEEDFDFFQLSVNALYEFGVYNVAFTPYAGAGIGISRKSFESEFRDDRTDAGLNLIGGVTFGFGNLRPFAQAQITVGDFGLFTIGGGLLFSIGN